MSSTGCADRRHLAAPVPAGRGWNSVREGYEPRRRRSVPLDAGRRLGLQEIGVSDVVTELLEGEALRCELDTGSSS
jgi:hypothetical protein